MDKKLKKYQQAILKILKEYAEIKYANVDGGNVLIADKDQHHYLIMTIGWEKEDGFIHDSPMHFDIIGGKIWVQANNTEWEVGEMLEEQGVSKEDIVLGFLTPSLREYGEYAVA